MLKELLLCIMFYFSYSAFSQDTPKNKKIYYLADIGFTISNVSLRDADKALLGGQLALKMYQSKWKLGLRLRTEEWLYLSQAQNTYISQTFNINIPKTNHYELTAFEIYKRFLIGKEINQAIDLGAGVARISPYYVYRPKVDTISIVGGVPYYSITTRSGPKYFITAFVGMPIHWFNIELRGMFPIGGKPNLVKNGAVGYYNVVEEGRINLSVSYTLGQKYYQK